MNKTGDIPSLSFFLKRKYLSVFLLLMLTIFLFKGSIYRACVSYKIIQIREPIFTEQDLSGENVDLNETISEALDATAERFSFTTEKCKTHFNLNTAKSKTNCIGYANYCAKYCAAKIVNNAGEPPTRIKTAKAQLYIFGFNIHQLFDSPFWKDHDIVLITETKTGERTLLDPTLYDYTGIGKVSERK